MINFKSFFTAATAIAGLLTIGAIAWTMPASASEILIAQLGAAQHLEDTEEKSASEWHWQVGGEAPPGADNSETDYEIRKSNNLFDSIEVNPRSQQWENQNLGDSQRDTARIPVVKF